MIQLLRRKRHGGFIGGLIGGSAGAAAGASIGTPLASGTVVHYPEWEVFPVKELNSRSERLFLQNKSALEIEASDEASCAARCAACLIHRGGFLVWSALIRRGFELIHGTPAAP